jgi:aryl-alcohol dehydrogenase-like predicted oxidoreductase
MLFTRLGSANLTVSRLGLGTMGVGHPSWREWVLDEDASRQIVKRALDLGINLIDTCDFYSLGKSEEVIGRLMREFVGRSEVVLATKVGNPMGKGPNAKGYSRKHLFEAVDQSLKRLGTDYIDLYQTHIWDPAANLEEMVEAFGSLVRSAGFSTWVLPTCRPGSSPKATTSRCTTALLASPPCRTTTTRSGVRMSAS